jgi:hypothetical protein
MHPIDLSIFLIYMIVMLGIGFYFLRRNVGAEDFYVGGRGMGSLHVGMSVVATDVGRQLKAAAQHASLMLEERSGTFSRYRAPASRHRRARRRAAWVPGRAAQLSPQLS